MTPICRHLEEIKQILYKVSYIPLGHALSCLVYESLMFHIMLVCHLYQHNFNQV